MDFQARFKYFFEKILDGIVVKIYTGSIENLDLKDFKEIMLMINVPIFLF